MGQNSVILFICVLSYQDFIGIQMFDSFHYSTNMKGITA